MITVRVFTPEKEAFKPIPDVNILNIDTTDGRRGILPNHMSLVLVLDIGRMELQQGEKRLKYTIAGGMLYFDKKTNTATVLTDAIEDVDRIDISRAQQAKQRAEERLQNKKADLDVKRAQIALRKAVNRINAAQNRA